MLVFDQNKISERAGAVLYAGGQDARTSALLPTQQAQMDCVGICA